MSVKVQNGASTQFTATLQDFKDAFAQTGNGDFKYTVAHTKGQLYVKDGKICSANTWGGSGSVTSSVTNQALRTALVRALNDAGASATFMIEARKKLGVPFGKGQPVDGGMLLRSDVRQLFDELKKDLDDQEPALIGRVGIPEVVAHLSRQEFQLLARGKGDVGQAGNANYNAALRQRLYDVVRNAEVPEGQGAVRQMLLDSLAATLIAPQHCGKPLSCEEIRRTLEALSAGRGFVAPKPLSAREVKELNKTGDSKQLAALCTRYEQKVAELERTLAGGKISFTPDEAASLMRLAEQLREMAAIGRQALAQKVVDVDQAMIRMRHVQERSAPANGPVQRQPVAPQQEPPVEAHGSETMIRTLFAQTGTKAAEGLSLSAEGLDKAMEEAKQQGKAPSEGTAERLRSAREKAEQAMTALAAFSGKALALAVRAGDLSLSPAGRALNAAFAAQRALADVLSAANRETGVSAFDELSHHANRYAAELVSHVGRLADEYERDGDYGDMGKHAVDLSALERRATDDPLVEHALANIEREVAPVLERLEAVLAPGRDVHPAEFTTLRDTLAGLKEKIADARLNGVAFSENQTGRTMLDATRLREIETRLDNGLRKLDERQDLAVKTTLLGIITRFRLPDGFSIQNDYQQGPSLQDTIAEILTHLKQAIESGNPAGLSADANRLKDSIFMALPFMASGKLDLHHVQALPKIVDLVRTVLEADHTKLAFDSTLVKSLLIGDPVVDDKLIARVFGYGDDIVDTEVSGQEPTAYRPLGEGASTETFLCTFEPPEGGAPVQRVFKPEDSSLVSLQTGVAYGLYEIADFQRSLDFNLASNEIAEMMGIGERLVTTKLGHLNGEPGMFMSLAPGKSVNDLTGGEGALEMSKIKIMMGSGEVMKGKVRGNVMRQLNQLQWLDMLSGQLDRHNGNFFIDISPDGSVQTTGIDNDTAFGEFNFGIGKYRVGKDALKSCLDTIEKSYPNVDKLGELEAGGGLKVEGNEVEIDLAKLPLSIKTLVTAAIFKFVSMPTCMDSSIYDAIMRLSEDGGAEYRKRLKTRHLSEAQLDAAVARLMDARKIAAQMKAAKLVYNGEWFDPEKQEELLKETPLDESQSKRLTTLESIAYKDDYFRRPNVLQILA